MKRIQFLLLGVIGPLFFSCQGPTHPRDWKYREVPARVENNARSEYFIILGGPLAYGSRVSAEESLANQVQLASDHYSAYNRAHPEATFETIMLSLENRFFLRGVKEITGVVALVLETKMGAVNLEKIQQMKEKLSRARTRFILLCANPAEWQTISCFKLDFKSGVVQRSQLAELIKRF